MNPWWCAGNFPLHWSLTGTYVTTFDEGVEITLTTDLRTKDVAPLKEQACTDMFDILGGAQYVFEQ